ncbi:MAG: DNA polymerase Y family protein [Phycisphaeraceae bacterium]|nr:MAG: DNA polymerase Y family protein [Phycisphaeraceae bacterium]
MLLVTHERQRQIVARCCERAASAGVRPGMPAAQARALFVVGAVRIEPYDPETGRRALRRLAVWGERFSPVVALDEPDGLLLDVTGCERVWAGEQRLLHAATRGLAALGFVARASIAPTFAGAWGVARFGPKDTRLIPQGGERDAIAPLPIAALQVDPETVAQLAEIGIERVGDLLALPRSTMPPRFGPDLLLRLDRALGQAIEIIEPVRPTPPPEAQRVFEGPTSRTDAIGLAVRELIDEIAGALAARSCGARRLEVELARSDLEPHRLAITLARPSRDGKHLWALVRPGLERAHLGFGVEGVRVRAPAVGRIRHEQAECLDAYAGPPPAEIERSSAELLDTLGNRLGLDRVLHASPRASHLPERAFQMRRASDPRSAHEETVPKDRPTVLFDRPAPIDVLALTPDGPVHRVSWRGETREITACLGPERIAGEWWGPSPGGTREYFAVRTDRGEWLWLARSIESRRWFVHGVWA